MSRGRTTAIAALTLLLVANLIIFFTYRVRQQERIAELKSRRDAFEARLLDAKNARQSRERQFAGYRQVREDIDRIYKETWSTPDVRLTPLLIEMQKLATRSELIPKSISYSYAAAKTQEETESMKIAFAVQGRYEQVRRLISLIEKSEQFVAIDSINLSSGEGDNLQLTLTLATLFRNTKPAVAKGRPL